VSGTKTVNLAALRARLWSARGDLPALTALNEELSGLSGPGVSELQRQVAASIHARPAPRPIEAPLQNLEIAPAPADLVETIRARAKAPDQPLYRYGVSDVEFAALRQRLDYLHGRGALEQANDRSAAAFVLYFAEWFRREYAGGGYSWDAPYPIGLSHPARKALATDGLKWWGRKPRRAAHGELRLMSLALEGGFPTRLLESRENSRIAQHLARLLSQAETAEAPSEEAVDSLSRSMGENLGTYDHAEFHALCAELVLAILNLKADALAQAPKGVPPTAWLDGARPNWRDELPIVLPGEGARRLLDDLVSAASGRIAGEGAIATRLLVRELDQWIPAATVRMAGEVDLRRTSFRPSDGRLRVRPANALAGMLAGELGLIDPPTDQDQHWLCRARGGRDFEVPIGFNVDLELELRSGASASTMVWPGGAALRGEVLVFADQAGDEPTAPPQRLVFLGQGSVRTRRKRVFCAVPSGYDVKLADSRQRIDPFGRGVGFTLYEATAALFLIGPGGDAYRVDVGADNERMEHLAADGTLLRGVEGDGPGLQVFLGSPTLSVRAGAGRRAQDPPAGELYWRPVGEPSWRPWQGRIGALGLIETIWRDGPSGVLRDRLRFVALPADLSITSAPNGHFRTRIELGGAADWALSLVQTDQVTSAGGPRRLDLEVNGQPQRRIAIDLAGPGVPTVRLFLRPRYSAVAFFRPDGRMFDDRAPVMIDDLRGAAAFGEGREQLYLTGPSGGHARIDFDDELPLWSLTEDVARLLSGGRDLDDHVVVEFGRSANARLMVGRYSSTIEQNAAGLVFVKTGAALTGQNADRRLEWFSILNPGYHELSDGREFALMPPALIGPGVAILRQARRIIGRPTFVQAGPIVPDPRHSALQRACMLSVARDRGEAIDSALGHLSGTGTDVEADHAYLQRLVSQLDGLPPSALDPLKRLAANPSALAALLAGAPSDEHRAAIWGLERDLPFLWAAAPVTAWAEGFQRQEASLAQILKDRGLDPNMAMTIAQSSVRSAATNIANLDPGLRVVMTFCQLVDVVQETPPTIFQAAQGRVVRADINERDPRIKALAADPSRASCFRPDGVQGLLPNFSSFMSAHWEGLDAACACALSAAGKVTLTDRQVLTARNARAEEPVSFNDMYAAALSALARGDSLVCVP